MGNISFTYADKTYELVAEKCRELLNDEIHPVSGIGIDDIMAIIGQQDHLDFERVYYDQACPICRAGKLEKEKYFKFLEYHFNLLTKEGAYVITSLSKDYQSTSFEKLLKKGTVDNSYIVSVIVCESCGDYAIEITQCDL